MHHDLNKCVHELFEEQVQRTPDVTALVDGDQHFSYADLNKRANCLGRYLRGCGIGLETLVGICLESSADAVIAALAILKAGAGYISIPPNLPEARIREMTFNSCRLVLTAEQYKDRIVSDLVEPICIDVERTRINEEKSENIRSGVCLDNAALVRYTSGSTGKPKGVINIHRSITSRLSSGLPDIQPDDICGLNTSLGLGARLFLPLACGATVVIISDDDIRDVRRLVNCIEKNRISSIFLVPTLLRQVLACPGVTTHLRSLRIISVGGETLTRDMVSQFNGLLPNTRLINIYGSNEIGTTAAMREMTGESDLNWRSVGHAVANTRLYILDQNLDQMSVGAFGEIHVGSAHIARGYINSPLQTARQFVPDPFANKAGARLYRTGDLGRYNDAGEIEFLGRADHQVKIRGFRVELGEIEAVLLDHPDVSNAAVGVWEVDADRRLVAYVVKKEGTDLAIERLRAHLTRQLPHHMVPARLIFVDELPLTANWKVNRQALMQSEPAQGPAGDQDTPLSGLFKDVPRPDAARPDLAVRYQSPRNATEAALLEIWKEVLGLRTIGINDGFLDLGGDSLLATRILFLVSSTFEVNLTFKDLFDHSTVAELSQVIDQLAHERPS
jgi:amino acid adenylation domain-containing protein